MPLTIEIEPQIEARLRAQAAERGVSVEAEAARRLAFATLTDEEREELEDELDVAAANRAREEDWLILGRVKRWTICVAPAPSNKRKSCCV